MPTNPWANLFTNTDAIGSGPGESPSGVILVSPTAAKKERATSGWSIIKSAKFVDILPKSGIVIWL